MYLNGVEDTGGSTSHSNPSTTDHIWIGGRMAGDGDESFDGKQDNLTFWNTGLSATEVLAHYNGGFPQADSITAYYKFEDVTNTTSETVTETTTADATVVGVELDGTFYPSSIESNDWVHHVLTKETITGTFTYDTVALPDAAAQPLTAYGDPTAGEAGISGYSHYFDGNDHYAENDGAGQFPELADAKTVFGFFKWDTTLSHGSVGIVERMNDGTPTDSDEWVLGICRTANCADSSSPQVYIIANNQHYQNLTPLSDDGEWHSIAFTADSSSGTLKIYYDGELTSNAHSSSVPSGFFGNSNGIGQVDNNYTPRMMEGWLDEISLWERELSAEEIKKLHDANGVPATVSTTDLVRYYNFDGTDLNGQIELTDITVTTTAPTTSYYANGVLQSQTPDVEYGDETNGMEVSATKACETNCTVLSGASVQSTGSSTGIEVYYGSSSDHRQFVGQQFNAGHELAGATISEVSFDLQQTQALWDGVTVYHLAHVDADDAVTLIEQVNFSYVESQPPNAAYSDYTFNNFTPFTINAGDKIGIYSDGCQSGYCGSSYNAQVAYDGSDQVANSNMYQIHSSSTGVLSGDLKYDIDFTNTLDVGYDAQIDDIVIFDEAISYFAVETLYDSGNARPPTE